MQGTRPCATDCQPWSDIAEKRTSDLDIDKPVPWFKVNIHEFMTTPEPLQTEPNLQFF